MKMPCLSLYIHIPFCVSKCLYCDFLSGIHHDENLIDTYIKYLVKELSLYKDTFRAREVKTIYIGGGTPSLLNNDHLEKLFSAIENFADLKKIMEITIEVNPDDVTKMKAIEWKNIGIDRVSLGFQSMDDKILRLLGRRNAAKQNITSFNILRNAGFKNISVDVILAINGGDGLDSLKKILKLRPEHLSAYTLTIEENTPIYRSVRSGSYFPVSDKDALEEYWAVVEACKNAGFIHYEISNFARDISYQSLHNKNYWNYGEYIGAGLGASGYSLDSRGKRLRWTNVSALDKYFDMIDRNVFPRDFTEEIGFNLSVKEYIMLKLREIEGISLNDFHKVFQTGLFDLIEEKKLHSLSEFIKFTGDRIRFTRRGIEVANRVIVDIWEMIDKG